MNTASQTHDDAEVRTEDSLPADLNPMIEYNAYRKAADTAYDDSIHAYDNMDKWMLTLAGGAFALSATLASSSSNISIVFYLGILLFAISTSVLLYSKYASYIMCEMSSDDVETAYQRSPDCFAVEFYRSTVGKTKKYNRRNQVKNAIGLWTFIAGIACISLGLLPTVVFRQTERIQNDYSTIGATEADATSVTAATSAQGPASTKNPSTAAAP